ncbi:MAG: hypothetical protein KBO60_00715 [Achromobacter sp.]|jgi:hypothetical protein|uniref:hypothetical protein n=1 Tax=unclassified Achromobacter TaxID=2626865 RepID=UPI0018D181F0|nr:MULTISPECIES: hypothetical protein [unclassified Achromobacter]MCG2599810.1 hypothetical protein [Achromobacter sp.]MCG2601609.1 hypothetical protein [Achromobacter sp.]
MHPANATKGYRAGINWQQMAAVKHIPLHSSLRPVMHRFEADVWCMTHYIGAARHNKRACVSAFRAPACMAWNLLD